MIERYSRPAMKQVWSDKNKYDKWLLVELAVCEAWSDEGVIPSEDMETLRSAKYDINRLNEILGRTKHDVTAFMSSVTENLGQAGRWFHLGLTSSDVWDTATSLQLIEATTLLQDELYHLQETLRDRAIEHKNTIMMGRTHGVHAEPITLGLKMSLWWDETRRNCARLERAKECISVGKISGPVGTHATVPPTIEERVCKDLGIKPTPISNQIIQRDRHAEFMTTLAIIGSSLEKFATEIRALQRTEIHEVEEPFKEGQTGSSSMPHKRNPELSERICGLARLIRGNALTAMENVALWGERDISHSSTERIILPDACLALDYSLNLFTGVMKGLRVFPDRMLQNMDLTRGLVFSQRIMLALVDKGVSREKAYHIVQNNAAKTWDNDEDFKHVIKRDEEATEYLNPSELDDLFKYDYYLRHVNEIYKNVGLD